MSGSQEIRSDLQNNQIDDVRPREIPWDKLSQAINLQNFKGRYFVSRKMFKIGQKTEDKSWLYDQG